MILAPTSCHNFFLERNHVLSLLPTHPLTDCHKISRFFWQASLNLNGYPIVVAKKKINNIFFKMSLLSVVNPICNESLSYVPATACTLDGFEEDRDKPKAQLGSC